MSSSAASTPTSSGASTPTQAAAAPSVPSALGNRKVCFHIKTGGKTWNCTLQDRSHYERVKASRSSSVDSTTSE
ncbi:hypothetical protein VHEMI04630 [[Torrubiella] hemipterigena]|uniref:Uncharacterized protein n=1 Tax=[Torrubiella] hemipterigena TaxID=1531966 RepID=A0A0A1TEY4_9HYPO|nr:hypothetical protein VHEMI04630 [[Torrubiella] hemipterigena]